MKLIVHCSFPDKGIIRIISSTSIIPILSVLSIIRIISIISITRIICIILIVSIISISRIFSITSTISIGADDLIVAYCDLLAAQHAVPWLFAVRNILLRVL